MLNRKNSQLFRETVKSAPSREGKRHGEAGEIRTLGARNGLLADMQVQLAATEDTGGRP